MGQGRGEPPRKPCRVRGIGDAEQSLGSHRAGNQGGASRGEQEGAAVVGDNVRGEAKEKDRVRYDNCHMVRVGEPLSAA